MRSGAGRIAKRDGGQAHIPSSPGYDVWAAGLHTPPLAELLKSYTDQKPLIPMQISDKFAVAAYCGRLFAVLSVHLIVPLSVGEFLPYSRAGLLCHTERMSRNLLSLPHISAFSMHRRRFDPDFMSPPSTLGSLTDTANLHTHLLLSKTMQSPSRILGQLPAFQRTNRIHMSLPGVQSSVRGNELSSKQVSKYDYANRDNQCHQY